MHVDPETRRPTRLPAEFEAIYGPSAGDNRPRSSLRHPPEPPESAEAFDWVFGRAEIDLAGHVSNLWYWKVAEEFLDLSPLRNGPGADATLEAEFRSGIGLGAAKVHRAGSMLWVSAPDGTVAGTLSISSGR